MEWPTRRRGDQQVSNSLEAEEARHAASEETFSETAFLILFDPTARRHLASLRRSTE